ncbi:MAG: hypothetical protein ABI851_15335 [Saprospiraceae bacterium]
MANHVRIDHITQGKEGQEMPADRFSVNSEDFLNIYVEAELEDNKKPKGEYYKMIKGKPGAKVELGEPILIDNQYRFYLSHYALDRQTIYVFHFADSLNSPNFEDQWEIHTI